MARIAALGCGCDGWPGAAEPRIKPCLWSLVRPSPALHIVCGVRTSPCPWILVSPTAVGQGQRARYVPALPQLGRGAGCVARSLGVLLTCTGWGLEAAVPSAVLRAPARGRMPRPQGRRLHGSTRLAMQLLPPLSTRWSSLPDLCTAGRPLEFVLFDLSPVTHIDAPGIHAIETWIEEFAADGTQVRLGGKREHCSTVPGKTAPRSMQGRPIVLPRIPLLSRGMVWEEGPRGAGPARTPHSLAAHVLVSSPPPPHPSAGGARQP